LHPGLSRKHVSRGRACADFDNDGDQDFAVADLYEGVRLYRNDMATGNWLKVRLRSKNASGQPRGFGDGSTAIAWPGLTRKQNYNPEPKRCRCTALQDASHT
jgi:hypothetical protein